MKDNRSETSDTDADSNRPQKVLRLLFRKKKLTRTFSAEMEEQEETETRLSDEREDIRAIERHDEMDPTETVHEVDPDEIETAAIATETTIKLIKM